MSFSNPDEQTEEGNRRYVTHEELTHALNKLAENLSDDLTRDFEEALQKAIEAFQKAEAIPTPVSIVGPVNVFLSGPPTPQPGPAVKAVLKVAPTAPKAQEQLTWTDPLDTLPRDTQGDPMPGTITVDTTNESASVGYVDDHNDPTAAPAGSSVAYASSDPAVATIDSTGKITPVAIGVTQIAAHLSGALEADGVTPIPDPTPVQVTVGPGPAAGAALVLSV